jgi:hypothetical protein
MIIISSSSIHHRLQRIIPLSPLLTRFTVRRRCKSCHTHAAFNVPSPPPPHTLTPPACRRNLNHNHKHTARHHHPTPNHFPPHSSPSPALFPVLVDTISHATHPPPSPPSLPVSTTTGCLTAATASLPLPSSCRSASCLLLQLCCNDTLHTSYPAYFCHQRCFAIILYILLPCLRG